MTPEEYQARERRRAAFQRSLAAKLTAPAQPAADVKKAFAPLTISGKIRGQSA